MSPRCLNCDSYVTDDFVRVFAHRGEDSVRHCPHCTATKDGSEVRLARSKGRPDQIGEVASK